MVCTSVFRNGYRGKWWLFVKDVTENVKDRCRIIKRWNFMGLQKTRYAGGGVEEQLPPPPSPPQLKEASQLDGVPRPNSVDRILHPDGSQHILTSHDTLNKVMFHMYISLHRKSLPYWIANVKRTLEENAWDKRFIELNIPAYAYRRMLTRSSKHLPSVWISWK